MIIPSIDLMDGKAVQLVQGKKKILESKRSPVELAKEFNRYGEVAVIDLDAALGKGNNTELIKELCSVADCRVGGGIRTVEQAVEYLRAGAKKIIIGTQATPDFLSELPPNRVIAAVDTKQGFVVNRGWTNTTKKKPQELMKELAPYCNSFLFTNVDKEGGLQGADLALARSLNVCKNLTFAGGISTIEDIEALEKLGIDAQVGMAVYTGKFSLQDAFCKLLAFKDGLVPTIVEDDTGQVLMLAYSNEEAVRRTLTSGRGTYWSRSRQKIWEKGKEESSNFQEILKIRYDCDRDTLLYRVKQTNVACHTGRYSCFGDKQFSLENLYGVIRARIVDPPPESYTAKISRTESAIKGKIAEESQEVCTYTDDENLVWECADLLYFLMVLLAKKNIPFTQVMNELWRRRK